MGCAAAQGRLWWSVTRQHRELCQGAPGAVVPGCPGLRAAPNLRPPAWLFAEICRCAGPWEVRNARSFPKTPSGKGLPSSHLAPVLGWRLWMSRAGPGACPRPCHTCAGSVSPLAVLSEAGSRGKV